MDLKPDINAGKILATLDGLAEKIPEGIASILKKVAMVFLAIGMAYGIYVGWKKGSSSAEPEGQKIAEDTRSLFYEDLEKAYNRKKKNIRFSDMNDEIVRGQSYKKEYEYYTEKPETGLVKEKPDFLRPEAKKKPEAMDTLRDTEKQISDPTMIPGRMTPEDESEIREKSENDVIRPKNNSGKKTQPSEPEKRRKLIMPGDQ